MRIGRPTSFYLGVVCALVFALQMTPRLHAQVVVETIGADNLTDTDFYRVTNNSAKAVSEITFDISSVLFSYWDFDGNQNFQGLVEPGITFANNMSVLDVTWSFGAGFPYPQVLTASISPVMQPGASFHFGADTDLLISDPCNGGNFGSANLPVSMMFADNSSCTANFRFLSSTESQADCGDPTGFFLTDPLPGLAGSVNTVSWTGAASNASVAVAYSFTSGTTPVGGVCPGLNVDMSNPVLVAIVGSDNQGAGNLSGPVSSFLSGSTILIQAVDITSCQASNLVTFTFP